MRACRNLAGLTKLKELHLTRTHVTADGVKRFNNLCPNARSWTK